MFTWFQPLGWPMTTCLTLCGVTSMMMDFLLLKRLSQLLKMNGLTCLRWEICGMAEYTVEQIEDAVDQYVQTWTRDELEIFAYEHLVDKLVKADEEEIYQFMQYPEVTKEE